MGGCILLAVPCGGHVGCPVFVAFGMPSQGDVFFVYVLGLEVTCGTGFLRPTCLGVSVLLGRGSYLLVLGCS